MKKYILTIIAAISVTASSYGQGLVGFNNTSAATSKISTNSVVGGAATGLTFANAGTVPTTYYYALFYSTVSNTVAGSGSAVLGTSGTYAFNAIGWNFSGSGSTYTDNGTQFASSGIATNTAAVGRLTGLSPDAVGGLSAGGSAYFTVIGWSANIGSTLAALQTWYNNGNPATVGWIGEGAVSPFTGTGDNNLATPPTILSATEVPGFTLGLVAVPEPTTIALASLGGLSLLAFRRRNKA